MTLGCPFEYHAADIRGDCSPSIRTQPTVTTMNANVERACFWYCVFVTCLVAAPAPAPAQDNYPSRTIKVVVPLPPGAAADTLPRILGDKLAGRWGQPVIIENKPGAALNMGAEAVARAHPDGYTLLATPPGPLVISQHFYPKLGFDPTAFAPVSVIASLPLVLIASPKAPVSTIAELIAYAKSNPDKLTYASSGSGSAPHLAAEMLSAAAGIRMIHVPYKGLAPALTDLRAGHVDVMIENLSNALPQIKGGNVKVLGVGSEGRVAHLPDVPALSEAFPGYVATTWFAMVAPPKTPPDIATKLSRAIDDTLRLPDVVKKLDDLYVEPVGGSPLETAAFLKRERATVGTTSSSEEG
jgi:tripartite-type tricarboxylate transporter receptor subunit TctC